MTPRRYFYPRVVIEFYHTMTSRREANPTALHFSIECWQGILRASDITTALHLPVVLSNAADYRQWPHPSTTEMVRLLSMDATGGTLLFRQHLPLCMLLLDHILWSNLFPLQHIVQRRGAILEALYRVSEGFWFNPEELIMTSLFHFAAVRPPLLSIGGGPGLMPFIFPLRDQLRTSRLLIVHKGTCPL